MEFTHKGNEAKRKTIETRVIEAVLLNCKASLLVLTNEVEGLYEAGCINKNDYNFLTDTETIKEIYG